MRDQPLTAAERRLLEPPRNGRGGSPLVAFWAVSFVALSSTPLWAIPSPDLVVNFFASAAQVLGLLTVVAGGVACSGRRRARSSAGSASRWAFRLSLGLLLVSLVANVLQYTRAVDARAHRLRAALTRSSTEGGKAVGDVNLKSLAFSDQLHHPSGIGSEELAARLASSAPPRLLDVREPEEVEQGKIAGARHVRYPDLRIDPSPLEGAGETVLLCFSGNRSSELCDELTEKGYRCRFLVGGYEKWIAEGRPLESAAGRDPGALRDLPGYPRRDRLLDTPEVVRLVRKEGAFFVDVRYPGEFEKTHLPGAIDLPMRKLPSEELWSRLRALPADSPIVAPCYDKRSSFYARVLGLRLHRLGLDYRGRYTVPHEYPSPEDVRPHVARWRAEQEGRTLLGMVSRPLRASLDSLHASVGRLGPAIVLLVILLRLLLLPFSLKAERDQWIEKRIAPKIRAWKEAFGSDPGRFRRAVGDLHRRHRLTPLGNLAGTVIQIVLFVVFFSVVLGAARGSAEPFLWLPALGEPDPYRILPLGVGLSTAAMMGPGRDGRRRLILRSVLSILLAALTWNLVSAVNVYLVTNLGLLVLHHRLLRRWLARRDARSRDEPRSIADPGIVPLRKAHLVPGTGNKAARLGRLLEAGFPVPDGFAVSASCIARLVAPSRSGSEHSKEGPLTESGGGRPPVSESDRARLERAWRRFRPAVVAVRSSGLNEDGADQSYAGMFDTMLNVGREELPDALVRVAGSLSSQRASAYAGREEEQGGIVVQDMVPARYAGVLFTEHPRTTASALVELVEDLGESLVSGTATPDAYRFGRVTHRLQSEKRPPLDLVPLLELGRRVEELFGRPQDIEWAYANGRFWLLQARDITVSIGDSSTPEGDFERERRRLLGVARAAKPREVILAQNELSELLPAPSPFSLSVVERMWESGGSTDLACREFGVPYRAGEDSPPHVLSAFGRLYVDRREERRRLAKGPGAVASFRLARAADRLREEFRGEFLPAFRTETKLQSALDLSRFSVEELIALLDERARKFVEESYVEADRINIAADFYLKSAEQQLARRGLGSAALLCGEPASVVHQAMGILAAVRRGEKSEDDFLAFFGHRAPHDWELADPRYGESPELVATLVERSAPGAPDPQGARSGPTTGAAESSQSGAEPAKPELAGMSRVLRAAVERAHEFQILKEEAKHETLREFASLRALLLEIAARLDLEQDIFLLTLDEVLQLAEPAFRDEALARIARRRQEQETWKAVDLPDSLTVEDLEDLDLHSGLALVAGPAGALRGSWVSGEKETVGHVRVVRSPSEISTFNDGEILVARFTDPMWTPLFPRASGLITEVGGWLSHAAIVAREYRVPAIVGASGALGTLETGDIIRMCVDGVVQKIGSERRRHQRVNTSLRVGLKLQGRSIEALLVNLSCSGALVEASGELSEGEDVGVALSAEIEDVQAEVIRRTAGGGYALKFTVPLPALPADPGEGAGKN